MDSRRLGDGIRRARTGRRLAIFLAVYALLTALIGWRLVEVQVVSADEYRDLAQRQTHRVVTLPPQRGKVFDRSGTPLALSVPSTAVYANPRALRAENLDPTFVAAELEPVLDLPLGDIVEALARDAGFVYLGRQLPRHVGDEVRALRLPGIGVLDEPLRTYPAGELAAQIVGFAGIDGQGLSGIEASYDETLAGTPGTLRLERAPGGVAISSAPREVIAAEPGHDIVLTIDKRLQYTAERLLADAVEEHDAKGASAVLMDARTGEILAMASSPGYDPADIADAGAYERRNRAVTDIFEPGSVAKAVTLAAAVEEGLVATDEELEVPGSVTVGRKRFTDSTPQPEQTLTLEEIMARSSNVGTIMLAEELGEERLHDYMQRFGFGRATGLGFPGESAGLLPGPDAWYATTLPTVAIGQGVSGSLLQVAGVFQTIASGGEWTEPSLVHSIVDGDGTRRERGEPERRRAISTETADAVAGMLGSVVSDGTGRNAAVPGYEVAGKTGTAQKPSETRRGYEPGAYIATFAGFAPVDDPALVAAIMVDEPQEAYYGGEVAAPLFAELMEFALTDRRVAPSETGARPLPSGEPSTGQGEG
jgi:cell division protein FtsI (penicillin-binding protein 3)